ncbi:MAG: hypothetical protein IPJ76_13345 [Flavobacteriales bacterium]|nr:MAG: hypothetical protein IPJ76_13345 [Flavobacteriales bacterium]
MPVSLKLKKIKDQLASLAPILTISILLIACGGSPTEQGGTVPEQNDPRALVVPALAGIPDPPVAEIPLSCVRSDFDSYFKSRPSAHDPMRSVLPAHVDVRWASLRQKVSAVTVVGNQKRGVRIHHGLSTQGASAGSHHRYMIAVEVVLLIPTSSSRIWDVREVNGATYVVDMAGVLQSIGATWNDTATYFNSMFVRRTNETAAVHEQVSRGYDTRTYLFEWENRLELLMNHNNAAALTDNDKVRFASFAEPLERFTSNTPPPPAIEFDLRHHVCAIDVNGTAENVDNEPIVAAQPFRGKAADIGTPCPPRCKLKAAFPDHGIAVRTPCP